MNWATSATSQNGSWILGNAKTDSTSSNILAGVLYPYNKSVGIYHCPADRSTITGTSNFRFRSYSMSDWIYGNDFWVTLSFTKAAQLVKPGPSGTFIFVDEAEDSIDNGSFGVSAPGQWLWINWPTSRHGRGGTFSFADGHEEYWKWRDSNVLKVDPSFWKFVPAGDRDLARIQQALPQ